MNNINTSDQKWCSVFGEKVNPTFLSAFYRESKRYSFAFQMYMLTTRLSQMDEGFRQSRELSRLVLLDRGAVGDTLFALVNRKLNNMDDQDLGIYRSVCRERLPSSISDQVDLLLYLDVEPKECHRRMNTLRKRESEEGIPLAYLEEVDSCYFHLLLNWLGNRKDGTNDMNVGNPPPILIARWSNFGETTNVLEGMSAVLDGRRASPKVIFQNDKPEISIVYDTTDEIKEFYQTLGTEKEKASQTSKAESPSETKTATTIAINWSLTHDNPFKRVIMFYLSNAVTVICYHAKDLQPQTQTEPQTETIIEEQHQPKQQNSS